MLEGKISYSTSLLPKRASSLLGILSYDKYSENNELRYLELEASPKMQERFITMVNIVSEQKEQVKFKCWAGWASEDKMRDELHMKESFDRN